MPHLLASLLLLSCLLHVSSKSLDTSEDVMCGRRLVKTAPLIRNGHNAIAGQWPWHVAIMLKIGSTTEYSCGGSILNENTILTAAHCLFYNKKQISANRIIVSIGQTLLFEAGTVSQTGVAKEVIAHPEFRFSDMVNDIAVIKLASSIRMTDYVQPICLWNATNHDEMPIVGKKGTIVGFGGSDSDEPVDHLQQAFVDIVEPEECIKRDAEVQPFVPVESAIICARGKPGVSARKGDSGGGLYIEEEGRWYLRGTTSHNRNDQNSTQPEELKFTTFTDVAKYLKWIKHYANQS
uniref:Peptidase S1 domain-containing protein n=1 Tax=Anopheles dirus TaxID=7168 RepID=A0A182NCR4_9DIPT